MKRVAFLTYNAVGSPGDLENGWHSRNGRSALVLQGPQTDWSTLRVFADFVELGKSREVDAALSRHIDTLWEALMKALPELDQVVVYVGVGGAERALELAAGLPAGKVTFLYCECDLRRKLALMDKVTGATRIEGCCGGGSEMNRLFKRFLDEGVLAL